MGALEKKEAAIKKRETALAKAKSNLETRKQIAVLRAKLKS